MDPKADFAAILTTLNDHEVEYFVVGMLAAVLQGVPAVTLDVDIVHRRSPENVAKLLAALQSLDAVYRTDRRGLRPNESHLVSAGHHVLRTRLGNLDALGTLAGEDYDTLAGNTVEVDLEGVRVRVLELSRLISAKEAAGRPKDMAVLPLLRATLDEIRKRRGDA